MSGKILFLRYTGARDKTFLLTKFAFAHYINVHLPKLCRLRMLLDLKQLGMMVRMLSRSSRVHLFAQCPFLLIYQISPSNCKDIITQYSGKTVEINNSDAEGRLVLSDAVAHATKHYEDCDLVVDMATLTGAQLVSTGKMHAGILANTEELEQKAVKAGLASGDLCYPLLYAPELLKKEFNSKVSMDFAYINSFHLLLVYIYAQISTTVQSEFW